MRRIHCTWRALLHVLLLVQSHMNATRLGRTAGLNGTAIKCHLEGALIQIPKHLRTACMRCYCHNQQIMCKRLPICSSKCHQNNSTIEECCDQITGNVIKCKVPYLTTHKPELIDQSQIAGECTVQRIGEEQMLQNFDGTQFRFPNRRSCSFELTLNCVGNDFRIQLRNDDRYMKYIDSSINQTILFNSLFLHLDRLRVRVTQDKKVRVGRQWVSLPFLRLGELSIFRGKANSLQIRTKNGIRIVWSSTKVIVQVPYSFKSSLCGLCGNFNQKTGDDFLTKNGQTTLSAKRFFHSWTVGSCSKLRFQRHRNEKHNAKKNSDKCLK